jgi:hypothetical protein
MFLSEESSKTPPFFHFLMCMFAVEGLLQRNSGGCGGGGGGGGGNGGGSGGGGDARAFVKKKLKKT